MNTKIPLHQHYDNEKNNREELDHIKDQVTDITRQTGFKIRTLKRDIVGLENEENQVKSTLDAAKLIDHQRLNSIKEEINHQEKFKELYDDREETNRQKAGTALPDQAPSYNELTSFDHSRVKNFTKGEHSQQDQLVSTESKEMQANMKGQQEEGELEAKIGALKAELSNVKRSAKFKTQLLEHKAHHINNEIQEDESLDSTRRHNEELEAHTSVTAQAPEKEE